MKTVVFDLDDTLFPERDYVLSGFRAVGAWVAEVCFVNGFSETAAQLFAEGCRGRIFDEALIALGLRPDQLLIDSLVTCYRNHSPDICLFLLSRPVVVPHAD